MERSEARLNEADRARATLPLGVLAFRWASLAWMGALAATSSDFRRPGLAWLAFGAAVAWTAIVSARVLREPDPAALWFDLGLACTLIVLSGFVVPQGAVVEGRPFFATAYPAAAVLAWAVAKGLGGGLAAGAAAGLALILSRPANGIALGELTTAQWQTLANGIVTYALAGGAVGLVSRLIDRARTELKAALAERMREAQRAARLAEREALGRQIHDSVLQSLALVHKKGKELAREGPVDAGEVRSLAELAGAQERALRSLIVRADVEPPQGTASLRDHLEALGLSYAGTIAVTVSSAGAAYLPRAHVDEIVAAAKQAIDNAVEHAGPKAKVTVFVDERDDATEVTVRDDGRGFDIAAANGYGLRSMRGRIQDIGGRFAISSEPGGGTEIEMTVPKT
ncbi:MAG TPA: ATP-binding protein [Actinomycetota bacterium]|nr:ATP-binding protein [Actinomycetota bacterium]